MYYAGIVLAALLFMWPALFVFTLALFRQPIKANTQKIVISVAIMTLITLIMQFFQIQYLITLAQCFGLIMCFTFVFGFSIFYAILMSVTSYMLAIMEEIVYFLLVSRFHWDDFITIAREDVIFPAVVVALFNYFLSWRLYKMRFGFSLVPVLARFDLWNGDSKRKMKVMITIATIAVACLCFATYLWVEWFVLNTLIVFLFMVLTFHTLYKKEMTE